MYGSTTPRPVSPSAAPEASLTVLGAPTLSQTDLLRELEPVVEENLERHLKVAKDWMPHEYVPWSEGRDFAGSSAARRGSPASPRSPRSPAPAWS